MFISIFFYTLKLFKSRVWRCVWIFAEGNPITGDGYKSMNGQINMVTSLNGGYSQLINHNRVPPGGYSSGLW